MKNKEPKISVVFDYKKQATDTTPGTVWVRIYHSRTDRDYISTGVRVLRTEWSDQYHVIRRADAPQLNRMIQDQVDRCRMQLASALATDEPAEMPTTKQMRIDRSSANFLDFMLSSIESARINEDTRKHHMATYRLLCEWGKMRRYEHVTRRNILDFMSWIRDTRRNRYGQELTQTTLFDHYKRLHRYVDLAITNGDLPANLLHGITIPRGESKEREHLTDEEIRLWTDTPMPMPYLADARDRFIVQMGTGLSYRDLMSVDFSRRETINGHTVITSRRIKTGKQYFIVILPMAERVLERWGWQVPPISNVNYNIYLQRVAILCGIDKHVTSHTGRHTYACLCLSHGVRIEAVMRALGHTRIQTTQVYAKLVDMDVIKSFEQTDLI